MPSLGLGNSVETGSVQVVGATANKYSMNFDGTDDYIQFEDISLTGEFTISAWIKLDGLANETVLGDASDSDWIRFDDANDITIEIAGNAITVTNSSAFSTGSWIHFAAVRNGSNVITFYKNGSALSTTGTRSGTFAPISIGRKTGSATYFDGNIEEVALFNTDLSASAIQTIYDNVSLDLNQNFENYTSSANLQGWWRMGDGSDGEVSDRGDYQILDMSDITTGSNLAKTGDAALATFGAKGNNTNEIAGGVATLTYVDTGGLSTNSFMCRINAHANSDYLFPAGTSLDNPGWYKLNISAKVNTGTVQFYFLNRNVIIDSSFGETEFTNIIAYVRRSHNDASYLAIRDMGAGQIVYINSITASKVNGKVGIAVNMTGSDIEEDVPS